MYFHFYQVAMILSLLASLFVMVLMWRRRQSLEAKAMIALVTATFVWTLSFFLEANSNTLERQLFFNNIGYLGSMTVPVAWFIFSVNYTNGRRRVIGWKVILLCIIPFITVTLVWSNSWHNLMWSNEHLKISGPFLVTAKTYGPFFWGALTYNYILIVIGAAILMRRLFVGIPLYTGQAVSLIVAVSLPLVWNIIYVFNLVPLPRKDLTPVMFAISGIAIALGLMRFRLFTVIPFASKFVIQQLSDGVFVFDVLNRLLEANPAALKMLGVDKNIVGKGLEDLLPLSPVFECLSSVKFGRVELPLTVSGKARFYEMETAPMCDNQEQQVGWLATLHDITDLKEMQEQFITQDRLASIGQLTSGVAHELNNPLTGVIGFSDLLLQRELPDDIKQDLKTINDEAHRVASIVKNLLTFTRQQPQQKQPMDINENIQRVLDLRAYEQKVKNIQVNTRFDSDLPQVMGNGSQLQQVFFNIVINAEFFMIKEHGKGILVITTEKTGNSVRASFADDGPGISKENMSHLFTPFHTTKEVGKGTGLGLSICRGIVTDHGGRIWAESEPSKGATLIIELPVHSSLSPEGGSK